MLGSPPRAALIAPLFPWPPSNGTQHRVARVAESLLDIGYRVDVIHLRLPGESSAPGEAPPGAQLIAEVDIPEVVRSAWGKARWLLPGGGLRDVHPRAVLAVRDRLNSFNLAGYDVLWMVKAPTALVCPRPWPARTFVDLDDLEADKWRGRARLALRERRLQDAVLSTINSRRWEQLQRRLLGETTAIVCSEDDRARLALPTSSPSVGVVPNSYIPDGAGVSDAKTDLLLQGNLEYGPNLDAARWLTSHIMPLVWAERPETTLLLAGRMTEDSKAELQVDPRVTISGFVECMAPLVRGAKLCVAPIRYGGGTRVKLLEAFALGTPAVATPLAAYGLGALDGRHLALAKRADEFASAIVALLDSPGLRASYAEAARELFMASFSPEAVRRSLEALVGVGRAA